jgi:hypothetical protein
MMIDIASETWVAVRKRCEAGIEIATELLMRAGLQPHEYDAARGEIAAFRSVLALGEPTRVEPAGDYSRRKDRSGI